ncbi:hypothetical protein EOD39_9609 [Acipenser ruthenus]|uniref:Uncharacterized protein n=1 Tax=Acipenser ruthenus TaxID=7906 RepID=A0A662YUK7_ACIRT|nr:hypothetical protein EOD39_9609 [Acipenser ruthenus]
MVNNMDDLDISLGLLRYFGFRAAHPDPQKNNQGPQSRGSLEQTAAAADSGEGLSNVSGIEMMGVFA